MTEKEANTNYGFSDIHRYLNGQMTAKEMHELERAALGDPFLADAIEGYQNRDKQTSEKHLNEITAAVQGNQQNTKIITPAKRKRYGWLGAASVVFVLGTSVFVLYQNKNNKRLATVTRNNVKRDERNDSFRNENNSPITLQQDSVAATMQNAKISAKPKKEESAETALSKKKEHEHDKIASTLPSKKDSMLLAAAPVAALSYRSKKMPAQPSLSTTTDTLLNDSVDKNAVTGYTTRSMASSRQPSWTTDKGKPFRLSEVEIINMGKTKKKAVDTATIKPEGGWLFFQDYLFGKLNKKDSSALANQLNNLVNVELEFSVNETGSPYDVHVIQAPDSTTANKVVTAIEQGPKWISTDKKEKRLKIKF